MSCSGQHDLLSCYPLSPLCTLCRVRRSWSEGLQDKTKRLDPPCEEKKESLVASGSNGAAIICVLLGRKAEPTARQLQACMLEQQPTEQRAPCRTGPLSKGANMSYTCVHGCVHGLLGTCTRCARNSLSIPCRKAQQQLAASVSPSLRCRATPP